MSLLRAFVSLVCAASVAAVAVASARNPTLALRQIEVRGSTSALAGFAGDAPTYPHPLRL